MNEEERYRQIAREAADHAVHDLVQALGIDADNPREAQADFQTLRSLRRARERGAAAVIWAMVILVVGGIAGMVWDAISKGSGK